LHLIILKQIGSKPIRLTIAPKHWVIASLASLLVLVTGMFAGMYAAAQWGSQLPVVRDIEQSRMVTEQYLQSGNTSPLDAMAIRLAEMSAQLARLDAISARLLKSNGHAPEPTKANELGRGGIRQANEESLSFGEIQKLLEKTAKQLDKQGDVLSLIDADLQLARVRFEAQPNESPLDQPVSISRFGTRIDPITGRRSVHEGIDFMAPVGTPILAAASGVVVKAGYHAAYGNMVEIEHGNSTVTRYAHASRLFAKEGQKVRLGDKIALVGSTGRSTGPHLHFEVRVNDVPKDPHQFLSRNGMPRPGPATVTALNGILAESN
jgi:murein DD-endopeptidase MepM/ murein hydrolase activator NlpD